MEKLLAKVIHVIEALLKPLKEKQMRLWLDAAAKVSARMLKVQETGEDPFKPNELVFAAFHRCPCGAGLAYPKGIGARGSWDCSDILMGKASVKGSLDSVKHTAILPFIFHSVKSEIQPSAYGTTTRPKE